jgi:pimeloyl-ACP methyl ester carboxylesterase
VTGTGSPLLLIAGTGYPGSTWPAHFIEPLAERHSVVTFDHRGTGTTSGTDDTYSTRLFAADAAGLITDLGLGPAHVLGHSMGGRVAQWLALDHPHLVRSIVLASSGPGAVDPSAVPPALPLDAMVNLIEMGFEGYIGHQIRSTFFTPEFREEHPDVVQDLIDTYLAGRPTVRDYLKHVAARQLHRTYDLVPDIHHQTLVLVGGRDTHVGGTGSHYDQAMIMAERLPDARFRVIDDVAHGIFWHRYDVTLDHVTSFLATRD